MNDSEIRAALNAPELQRILAEIDAQYPLLSDRERLRVARAIRGTAPGDRNTVAILG